MKKIILVTFVYLLLISCSNTKDETPQIWNAEAIELALNRIKEPSPMWTYTIKNGKNHMNVLVMVDLKRNVSYHLLKIGGEDHLYFTDTTDKKISFEDLQYIGYYNFSE